MAVNLKGTLFCCQEAAKIMVSRSGGSIVNVTSGLLDTLPPASGLAYGMSKAAIHQLTRTMAVDLGPSNVRVNSISPGVIVTDMSARHYTREGVVDEKMREERLSARIASTPLRRLGEPEDVAYAALFLASDAARFWTGQTMRPDGGISMPW
jgi:3-oxoacyl-[acyl-carrier protein] reductase